MWYINLALKGIIINSANEIATSPDKEIDKNDPPCCTARNQFFHSIVDVLSNVTSNAIVNLAGYVMLSSNVILNNLENVTISGQGNSTVNCNGIGAVKFVSCNNVTIKGVNWERCGSNESTYPGMEFYNSSDIVIQNCFFHHSTGQAIVVLSKVSGNVYINNCQFTHNKYHEGHGAAIHYTSSPEQRQLVINNCDFTWIGPAESVVFIDNSNNTVNGLISLLQNCTFIQNQGVPIYISHVHTSVILNNSVSFKDSRATAGGGIYCSNSIIKFDDKCNAGFYNNSVTTNSGAIY